jgi:hypothetical protein
VTEPGLTKEEQDFARWMEEVDLEELNLLGGEPPPAADGWGATDKPSTQPEQQELPPQRGVGWDEG